jgi:hypothetical protein
LSQSSLYALAYLASPSVMMKNLFKLLTPVVNVLNLNFLVPNKNNSLGLASVLFVPVKQTSLFSIAVSDDEKSF